MRFQTNLKLCDIYPVLLLQMEPGLCQIYDNLGYHLRYPNARQVLSIILSISLLS